MKQSFYLLPIFLATLTVNAQQTYTFDCNGTVITISIEEYQAFLRQILILMMLSMMQIYYFYLDAMTSLLTSILSGI